MSYGSQAYGYGQPPSYPTQSASPVYVDSDDDWSSCDCKPDANQLACLVVGIALAALAGVASYFCLTHGLALYDMAFTSLETFGAGFLIYAGVAFSCVSVGNALYTGGKFLLHERGRKFEYTPDDTKIQVGISILAPVAAVPAIIVLALGCLKG